MGNFPNSFTLHFFPRYVFHFLPYLLQKSLVIFLPDIPTTKERFFYETDYGNFVVTINEEESFNFDESTCTTRIIILKIF